MIKKRQPPDLMERARAARAIVEATQDEGTAMMGFLALFHPELDPLEAKQLSNDARERQRQRSRC